MKICFRLLLLGLLRTLRIIFVLPVSAQEVNIHTVPGLIADGKPWHANMGDGHIATIIFQADGTGRFEGPLKRNVTWEVKNTLFCVHIGFPAGTKCVTVRKTDNGFDFYKGNKKDLALTR